MSARRVAVLRSATVLGVAAAFGIVGTSPRTGVADVIIGSALGAVLVLFGWAFATARIDVMLAGEQREYIEAYTRIERERDDLATYLLTDAVQPEVSS